MATEYEVMGIGLGIRGGVPEATELELKYCERCGGLWLRRTGSDEVYCTDCVPKMAEVKISPRGRVAGEVSSREDRVPSCEYRVPSEDVGGQEQSRPLAGQEVSSREDRVPSCEYRVAGEEAVISQERGLEYDEDCAEQLMAICGEGVRA